LTERVRSSGCGEVVADLPALALATATATAEVLATAFALFAAGAAFFLFVVAGLLRLAGADFFAGAGAAFFLAAAFLTAGFFAVDFLVADFLTADLLLAAFLLADAVFFAAGFLLVFVFLIGAVFFFVAVDLAAVFLLEVFLAAFFLVDALAAGFAALVFFLAGFLVTAFFFAGRLVAFFLPAVFLAAFATSGSPRTGRETLVSRRDIPIFAGQVFEQGRNINHFHGRRQWHALRRNRGNQSEMRLGIFHLSVVDHSAGIEPNQLLDRIVDATLGIGGTPGTQPVDDCRSINSNVTLTRIRPVEGADIALRPGDVGIECLLGVFFKRDTKSATISRADA